MNTSELTIPIEDTEVKILMQAGFFHFSNIQTPLHDHIYAEIHLIEQGSFNFYIDGICHRFEAGDVMAIPAGLYHYYTDASHNLRHFAFQLSLPIEEYRHIHLPTRLMADMMDAIDQYRRSGRRIKLIGYLSMLCSQFMEDKPGVVPQIEDRELLIYEFFSKRYNEDVSLTDLAHLLNLYKKQTERMVEKYTGRSFRAEIAHHRMEAAAQLMKIPGLSLSDIATRVGYKSYSGFWKAYKATSQNVL